MVKYRAYLLVGQFRRQIGTESYYRLIRLQGILVTTVIRFIAAVNTSSSFFIDCLCDCIILTTPPRYYSLFMVPSIRTSCLDHASSHLCSYFGNRKILFYIGCSYIYILCYILFLLVLMVELYIKLYQFLGTSCFAIIVI